MRSTDQVYHRCWNRSNDTNHLQQGDTVLSVDTPRRNSEVRAEDVRAHFTILKQLQNSSVSAVPLLRSSQLVAIHLQRKLQQSKRWYNHPEPWIDPLYWNVSKTKNNKEGGTKRDSLYSQLTNLNCRRSFFSRRHAIHPFQSGLVMHQSGGIIRLYRWALRSLLLL